ncbi:chorismate mutase 2-like [Salvia hispanica]|uniref:chorismate mutase 2-like n=1 Tax=Salvia hispanica TaxID=49212 RepID=UPI0020098EA8|nr:chorismate mutase 2-like [Salvia hispanica]
MGDCCEIEEGAYADSLLNLEWLRRSLVREEDSIIFSLIERSKYPINSRLYDQSAAAAPSLLHLFIKESEAVQAKAGRYTSPEENAFFPDSLPPLKHNPVLHPSGACININSKILNHYLNMLIPLIAAKGDDDRNYAATAASDLACLQALSRRIHYGKFVAEVKFRDSPQDYTPAILAKDKDGLMKLLTFESVEEAIKKRVEKKAMVFGQEVELQENGSYKVKPELVSQLYGEWVIPLTKFVQVEYLLRRLD